MLNSHSDIQSENIENNTSIGNFCVIRKNAKIGSNCTIGSFCFIDDDVVIGDNVAISNGSQIYKNTVIEDGVVIGSCVVIGDDTNCKTTNIGKFCNIPSRCVIKGGHKINNENKLSIGEVI